MALPKFDALFNPLLEALHVLGSSASIVEIEQRIAAALHLSDKDIATIHKGNRTQFSYKLAWARTYLKKGDYPLKAGTILLTI